MEPESELRFFVSLGKFLSVSSKKPHHCHQRRHEDAVAPNRGRNAEASEAAEVFPLSDAISLVFCAAAASNYRLHLDK